MPSRPEAEARVRAACQKEKAVRCVGRKYRDDGVHIDFKCPDCNREWGEEEKAPICLGGWDCSLADLLLALGNLGGYEKGGSFEVRHNGWITRISPGSVIGTNRKEHVCDWNLALPLSGQSDATVSALYGIISGKGNG